MSNNTNSQRMKRAAEIWKRVEKTQGKTPFKRSGQPKKPTQFAKSVKEKAARAKERAAARKALNTITMKRTVNVEGQRNAVRELQKLIGKRPPPLNRNRLQSMAKRRRLNIGRPVRFVKKAAKKIADKARKKTAAAKTIQRAVRARKLRRKSPLGSLNSNFAPIVSNNNNNNRNANANVNVFRNKNNIVRVRRTSNNVHGTKNRWSHKLKTDSTSNENLKNKHGNKNWHRHRPRGRYTSTTRCEFIAPKDALLRLASERGIQVNSKLSKAQICERLVNGS